MNNNPSQKLKSRKSLWEFAHKLIIEKFNLNSKWTDEWTLNIPDKYNIIVQPTETTTEGMGDTK